MALKWKMLDVLGSTVYRLPEPPPRTRSPDRPLQVICPGFPRSGTESLQVALTTLGYKTYHGWDVMFEEPLRLQAWCRLARKKYYAEGRPEDGDNHITRADLDELMGHVDAVTDAPASVFAAEMLNAYPEAKVVMNTRRDWDAWQRSIVKNALETVNDSWAHWAMSFVTARGFWTWMVWERLLFRLLFRATDESEGALGRAIRRNGKWIYREHVAMVKGMVPQDRLLEWSVEDGWEPLCKFLGKEVPNEPFPNVNGPAGFEQRVTDFFAQQKYNTRRNLSIIAAVFVAGAGSLIWRQAPGLVENVMRSLRKNVKWVRS